MRPLTCWDKRHWEGASASEGQAGQPTEGPVAGAGVARRLSLTTSCPRCHAAAPCSQRRRPWSQG